MARQSFTIGAPSSIEVSNGSIGWEDFDRTFRIAAPLLPNSALEYYLGSFNFRTGANFNVYITDNPTADERGFRSGQDLVSSWEQNPVAIRLIAGDLSLVIPGPDASSTSRKDPTEGYSWFVYELSTAVSTFVTAYNALSAAEKAATQLILNDGTDLYIQGGVTTGIPEAEAALTLGDPPILYFQGSTKTGVPSVSAALRLTDPPRIFCLDPDRSDTGAPGTGGDGARIFLELAPSIDMLAPDLPAGADARPLLQHIPQIRSDNSLVGSTGDINFSLDNRDGDFSYDLIGSFVRIWGFSSGKRQLFLGQISAHQISGNSAEFTASEIPASVLEAQVARRVISRETFPYSRALGAPVPVVFGRALRHRCHHISFGNASEIEADVEAGESLLIISETHGIAVGDLLQVGGIETVRVDDLLTVRDSNVLQVSPALQAGYPGASLTADRTPKPQRVRGAVVLPLGTREDYLLGEGVWGNPGVADFPGGRFNEVFRVYHSGRALPEFTCPESVSPRSLPETKFDSAVRPAVAGGSGRGARARAITVDGGGNIAEVTWESPGAEYAAGDVLQLSQGEVSGEYALTDADLTDGGALNNLASVGIRPQLRFTLDPQHRVQLPDWYRNYHIEFISAAGAVTGSADVIRYDPDENTVSFSLPGGAEAFTCYRLREYRFFDGSQAEPFSGYAFIRLARKYKGEIRADVRGFALPSLESVLSECFFNHIWGANSQLDLLILDAPGEPVFEGALTRPTLIVDILREIARFRPLRLTRTLQGLRVQFAADTAPVTLPNAESLYQEAPTLEFLPSAERVAGITVDYRLDSLENETLLSLREYVSVQGREEEIYLPYVYEVETADRVLYSEAQRQLGRLESVYMTLAPGDVSGALEVGGRIRIPGGLLPYDVDTDWVVDSLDWYGDVSVRIGATKYSPTLYSYPGRGSRDIRDLEDPYLPETDFSETPPEPVRNLSARLDEDDNLLCVVRYLLPAENCRGARVLVQDGDAEVLEFQHIASVLGRDIEQTIKLPGAVGRVRIVVYSLHPENEELIGFPISAILNESPLADAGEDQSVTTRATVTLDGSASSDPDNDPLTYSWRQLSGPMVEITNADKAEATFRAPSSSSTLEFELTISDGTESATDSLVVEVRAAPVYTGPRLSYVCTTRIVYITVWNPRTNQPEVVPREVQDCRWVEA